MSTGTCNCGRQWSGLAQAHCRTCHHHFSTVANFDRHRPGGECHDPAELVTGAGTPLLKSTQGPYGTTWVEARNNRGTGTARTGDEGTAA